MTGYTPDTEEVHDGYVEGVMHDCYYEGDAKLTPDGILAGEDFDRWLAEVRRQAAEEAWDACDSATLAHIEQHGTATEGWPVNPYKKAEG